MLLLSLVPVPAVEAHESDYSYLRLLVGAQHVQAEWEVHLRDARIALGLSGEFEGELAWAELRVRAPELLALLEECIAISVAEGPCDTSFAQEMTERPGGRDYVLLHFEADCPGPTVGLQIGYELLFDLDSAHRGFFAVRDSKQTHVGVFTATEREVTLETQQLDRLRAFIDYLREGMEHIWAGLDHTLFLVALLLPAPLRLTGDGWVPRERLGAVVREVVKIVTAFTLAHSITLTLATLDLLHLPLRWVEACIAVSVFAAAWNNLRLIRGGRAWVMAFAFGLVHGLGFAGALVQLGLPYEARGLALLSFNLGVEVGQLGIVAVMLPIIHTARNTRGYRVVALRGGSLAIAWLAAIWLLERIFEIDLLPFL